MHNEACIVAGGVEHEPESHRMCMHFLRAFFVSFASFVVKLLSLLFALASVLLAAGAAGAQAPIEFTPDEVRRILQHGPWPVSWTHDPSNRASGRPSAIALGERLFFDPRLSGDGRLACASCHQFRRGWSDGLPRAAGHAPLERNTQSLFNVRLNRWFGWDGAGDSLWAQSLRPIVDPREMNAGAGHVAGVVRTDAALACAYEQSFGAIAARTHDEQVLVDVAKALAAFQETIATGRTAFDAFRDALERGDRAAADRYPADARRGLGLFIGKGACSTCHLGPNFTNGEFHDVGLPHFTGPGRVDPGRHGGIVRLLGSRYNLLGPFNDDPGRTTAVHTHHVVPQHRNFGEFRVPSLRNVALTAPYMHDGSRATLRDAVRHYSELDENRLHADGERILKPLRLAPGEVDDLVAFLETLTAPQAVAEYAPAPAAGGCR